jgi:hypothetical protein
MVADYYARGARVSSNSWGANAFGAYTAESQVYDALTRDAQSAVAGNQELLFVFANGNAGLSGLGSVGSPATAKNVLSVGASETSNPDAVLGDGCQLTGDSGDDARDIAFFSSRGPCSDGRVKPDVVAPGTFIQGAASRPVFNGSSVCGAAGNDMLPPGTDALFPPGTAYTWSSGTSHSTPAIAGTCSLIQEFLARVYGIAAPSPALQKAYIVHSARRLSGNGANEDLPGNNQGFGIANLSLAFDTTAPRFLQDEATVFANPGESVTFFGSIPDPGQPVRVVLAWTDPPGPTFADAFVNDLNLTLTVDGKAYLGNNFSGGESREGGTPDVRNNVEAVFLSPGVSGPASITVDAVTVAADGVPGNADATDQDFALVAYNFTTVTSAGTLALDRNFYNCADTVRVTVEDADLASTGSVDVTVTTSGGDSESVTLSEHPSGSGVFVGSIGTAAGTASASDGTLQVVNGDTITATYEDADNGTGHPATVQASAAVDCVPPVSSNVMTIDVSSSRSTVTFDTDEPASVQVRYGTACGSLTQTQAISGFVTSHQVNLSGLSPGTRYFFVVDATDAAGNRSTDDNGGACYSFVTKVVELLGSTGNLGNSLIDIDPATGTAEFRATIGAFGPVTEIERRDDGVLFGATGGGSSNIITIDPVTGAETLVGMYPFGAVQGLEFVGTTLYGTYIPSPGDPSQLVIVDQTTAALTPVGATGFGNIGGLAYDVGTGTMFGVTSGGGASQLVTINLSTGAGALVGPVGFDDVSALEFRSDGTLYGGVGGNSADAGSLITIDKATGHGTLVGPTGFPALSGLAFLLNPRGVIALGRDAYRCVDSVTITVTDSNLRGTGTLSIVVTTSGGDSETVVLTETPAGSGVLRGTLPTTTGPVAAEDGTLQVADGVTITATYHDADDGTGNPATVQDTAVVDCVAPHTLSVTTLNVTALTAMVSMTTDEPTTALVRYGVSCGALTQGQSQAALGVTHLVTLTGLSPTTSYFYRVEVTDAAGNLFIDDNGGACFTFTTLAVEAFGVGFSDFDGSSTLYAVDPSSGAATPVGPIGFLFCGAIDFDIFGILFGTCERADAFDTPVLVRIDPSTGAGTEVGPTGLSGAISDISFRNSDGALYAYDAGAFPEQAVYRIDPTSGSGTLVGPTGLSFEEGNGMAFSPADVLYHSGLSGVLNIIDQVTGTATPVRPLVFPPGLNAPRLAAMDFRASDGAAVGVLEQGGGSGGEQLVDVDIDTGVVTVIGPTATGLEGFAWAPNRSAGVIRLDRHAYRCADTVRVTVGDSDLAGSGSLGIEITSSGGDAEPLVLTETAAGSGIFVGSIALAPGTPIPSDGSLQVANGNTVTATYDDADDGSGNPATVHDTAVVDCVAPLTSSVTTSDITAATALVSVTTNEPTTAVVRYGLACNALTQTQADGTLGATHQLPLTGLSPSTAYFYRVEVTDAAGNVFTDDHGGVCYAFTTLARRDYFTELFDTTPNDLHNQTWTFTPNGSADFYAVCRTPATVFPTDPSGGHPLALSDDNFAPVLLTGGATVSLYGTRYGSFYVGSNGYLTFLSGDTNYFPSFDAHFDQPRISALFDDLNPGVGGAVSWEQLSDRVVVTFDSVPHFGTSNSNSFQIELFFDGRIRITHLALAVTDGLMGLSAGLGTPPDFAESDLTAYATCPPSDRDGDGVPDAIDNCPDVFNPDQADSNHNGIGDACEPDSDGDGVPDSSDNCPNQFNPDQADADGNGIGDACDPDFAAGTLILKRVRLRAGNAMHPDAHKGKIHIRATVNVNAPYSGLVDDLLASGVTMHVTGAGGVDETAAWPGGGCSAHTTRLGPRLTCQLASGGGQVQKALFVPSRLPNVFDLKVSLLQRVFVAPLTADPVTVTLSTATLSRSDRIGETGTCHVRGARAQACNCKE